MVDLLPGGLFGGQAADDAGVVDGMRDQGASMTVGRALSRSDVGCSLPRP
jgi:hypothetical protein